MTLQKTLRLVVPRINGESELTYRHRLKLLNSPAQHYPPEKLLADLLKRIARRVMGDITECPANGLPAHLARLDDLRDLFDHLLRHSYSEHAEGLLSGSQLAYPHTLADFRGALEVTRQQHRAPAFINSRDAELAEINRKLDTIAGLLASSEQIENLLDWKGGAP